MTKLLCALLVVWAQLTLVSCTTKGVALSPLTEQERNGLGTIGIAAELSKLETLYSRDPSTMDDGLRAMQDRLDGAGQGAIDGIRRVYRHPIGNISCNSGGSRGTACLGQVLVAVLFKGVVMTGGAIVGGVVGAIDGKAYSYPPLLELPERAVIQAVQQSIDAVGLPYRLRDQVFERAQNHRAYQFELVPNLPADAQTTQVLSSKDNGSRYWSLRDKGIQSLLMMRIPLIEFQGASPEDTFRLVVHVEMSLLQTDDQACLRHRTWEYEGGSYRLDEWRQDDAKLLVDELDRGLPLIAQRVTETLFEQPTLFSFGASKTLTPKSESFDCPL